LLPRRRRGVARQHLRRDRSHGARADPRARLPRISRPGPAAAGARRDPARLPRLVERHVGVPGALMSFEHPRWLFGLLLLLPMALLEWRALVRAARSVKLLLGAKPLPGLLLQLVPNQRVRALALRLGAMALLGVGAAGPQWGREAVRRESNGS